jgi:hypothetical protein
MPGMLWKSAAFVPRYQWFESISLHRRVQCEPGFVARTDLPLRRPNAFLQRRVACELDITGSAIDVRSRLKLAAFIDDSENDVLSYRDFES